MAVVREQSSVGAPRGLFGVADMEEFAPRPDLTNR